MVNTAFDSWEQPRVADSLSSNHSDGDCSLLTCGQILFSLACVYRQVRGQGHYGIFDIFCVHLPGVISLSHECCPEMPPEPRWPQISPKQRLSHETRPCCPGWSLTFGKQEEREMSKVEGDVCDWKQIPVTNNGLPFPVFCSRKSFKIN